MPNEIKLLDKFDRFALHVAHYEAQGDVEPHAPKWLTIATIRDLWSKEHVPSEPRIQPIYEISNADTELVYDTTFHIIETKTLTKGDPLQNEKEARRWFYEFLDHRS